MRCKIKFAVKISLVTILLSSIPNNYNTNVKASTIDDVLELLGEQRQEERYSEDTINYIIKSYSEVKGYNDFVALYDKESLIVLNKRIKEQRNKLEGSFNEAIQDLHTSFIDGELPNIVIKNYAKLSNITHEISSIAEERDILDLEQVENVFAEDYMALMAFLEDVELTNSVDLGEIGSSMKPPLVDSFVITKPYGYNTSDGFVTYHDGLNLRPEYDNTVVASWNGVVDSVDFTNGRYRVVVDHQNGLKTVYGNLNEHFVTEGDSLVQYAKIGTVLSGTPEDFLYYEVQFMDTTVNPIYFYGDRGRSALSTFIEKSEDPMHTMLKSTIYEIKTNPDWLGDYRGSVENPYIPGEVRKLTPSFNPDTEDIQSDTAVEVTIPSIPSTSKR